MWSNLTQKLAQELRIATSFIYYPKILIPCNVGHSNRPPRDVGGKRPNGNSPSPTSRKYNKTCHLYGPHKWETIFVGNLLVGPTLGSDTILGMWPNLTQKLAQELRIATSFIYY
ncbi:unnamed protein product, partial [Arabidopsis halleri]